MLLHQSSLNLSRINYETWYKYGPFLLIITHLKHHKNSISVFKAPGILWRRRGKKLNIHNIINSWVIAKTWERLLRGTNADKIEWGNKMAHTCISAHLKECRKRVLPFCLTSHLPASYPQTCMHTHIYTHHLLRKEIKITNTRFVLNFSTFIEVWLTSINSIYLRYTM